MPSPSTSTSPNSPDQGAVEFLGLNLDAFRELVAYAEVAEGFTLAIAEVNFDSDGDLLVAALQNHPIAQAVQFVVLDFGARTSFSFLEAVQAELAAVELQPGRKVLLVRGLATVIGVKGDYPNFLRDLNYNRDQLAARVPYPLVLFLPDYALTRLAQYGKDFWNWKSGLFHFRTTRQTTETAQTQLTQPSAQPSDTRPVRQERIEQLERLLSEQQSPSDNGTPPAHPQSSNIPLALELGDAYRSLSELDQARRYYHKALDWAEAENNKIQMADGLYGLGQVHRLRAENTKATARFEQAMELYRATGARLGEANTLKAIGDVLQFLKRSTEALQNYEQAMELYRATGARLGEANTLTAIGDVLQFLDRRTEALQNYEQAMELYRATGDRLGEANVLQEQGKMEPDPHRSLQLLQQAQALYETIGDRYSQCRNLLRFVAEAQLALGQHHEAIKSLQCAADLAADTEFAFFRKDALQRLQEIGDVKASRNP
ncbi:tetratricopeptide repeat protein [Nodosilinea nodulosa]|uniref:tetratricopeptide repeat protein n=1 Tax=Nodosilinea nodulosa TaxID=416001 RepID=UPI0012D78284|nr:tetratricopeptide repeat protein [Nodosilinea nodulosa]